MSSENIERRIEFIINQQAKFAEDLTRLEAGLTRMEKQNRENSANIARLVDVVMSLANVVQQHDEQIAALIEHGKETDRRLKDTDDRLNALITIVERSITDGSNN